MSEILVVATGGAGGDLPQLVATSLALRERGHEIKVAARAEALGVAEVVPCEHATPETIGAAVKRTLADREMGRRAAKHSARLRGTDPPATAAARFESLLE